MPTTYNAFRTVNGYKSPGFEVTPAGNVTAGDITAGDITAGDLTAQGIISQNINTNIIDATSIKLNGTIIFGDGVLSSTPFQIIEQDFIVSEGSTPYLSIINGTVIINNRNDSIGKIDNVDIGTVTSALGMFTSIDTPIIESQGSIDIFISNINIGDISTAGISIPIVNTTAENVSIGTITPNTGAFTSVTLVTQSNAPTSATRKDYVDSRISAFSIAFGV